MLQVASHRDNDFPGRRVEAGRERRGLAVVPGKIDDADPRIALSHRGQRLPRAVGAAVVDVNDLGVEPEHQQHCRQAAV